MEVGDAQDVGLPLPRLQQPLQVVCRLARQAVFDRKRRRQRALRSAAGMAGQRRAAGIERLARLSRASREPETKRARPRARLVVEDGHDAVQELRLYLAHIAARDDHRLLLRPAGADALSGASLTQHAPEAAILQLCDAQKKRLAGELRGERVREWVERVRGSPRCGDKLGVVAVCEPALPVQLHALREARARARQSAARQLQSVAARGERADRRFRAQTLGAPAGSTGKLQSGRWGSLPRQAPAPLPPAIERRRKMGETLAV